MELINTIWFLYLTSAVCFVAGLHFMNNPKTARKGNFISMFGMLLACLVACWQTSLNNKANFDKFSFLVLFLGIGLGAATGASLAKQVKMTQMPQLVSLFNMVGGGAAAIIALNDFYGLKQINLITIIASFLGIIIGSITFTGSFIASAKLHGKIPSGVIDFAGRIVIIIILIVAILISLTSINSENLIHISWLIAGFSAIIGILFTLAIGGADMPVVISVLNAFTGLAVAMSGFIIYNPVMVIAGAIVGSAGCILSILMSRAMNRKLIKIMLGGFGQKAGDNSNSSILSQNIRTTTADDLALRLAYANDVIIIPGFGLAQAGAAGEIAQLDNELTKKGVNVKYAIHPVAGRMPGHMNILLAEANINYDKMLELEAANTAFPLADIALVVGANDVTNPAARKSGSAISGMPILNVDQAKDITVIKRGSGLGFAGIENLLYSDEKTTMLYGDAKKALSETVESLSEL
ncbi:MAG: NAD(P)(+) transhydrogenase (Re/Si-specific) subunit beta [Bifidobacteriaceae bacterium]|jgi:NAD(P) transhydrogenase subunit beta|nr:NAD(P)(+) transhydrogenase (Re/Si-specific) subunit beta [Bifidobacteriaceae bacterium]